MLSLEQLNALRGTKANTSGTSVSTGNAPVETESMASQNAAASAAGGGAAGTQAQAQQQGNNYIEPVEIPCKNYDDEEGHFAYIDANTHQTMHVNLNSGRPYTQDEINRLSLLKVARSLSDEAKMLTWQAVISANTLYDQFGYPMFTAEEVQNALYKMQTSGSSADNQEKPKTDAFGFPL